MIRPPDKPFLLVACECSGIVRRSFRDVGINAYSCDLYPPDDGSEYHFQCDVFEVLNSCPRLIVGIIAFPPCTYLAKVQEFRVQMSPGRKAKQALAVEFVLCIADFCDQHEIPYSFENPPGALSRLWRNWDDVIQPHWFGSCYRKQIALWLRRLPPLFRGPQYSGRLRHRVNHTNSRMSQVQKSKIKSEFYPEVAQAMAAQWSCYFSRAALASS